MVARWGLQPVVSDVDMCVSHFQLRLVRLTPEEREACCCFFLQIFDKEKIKINM